MVSSGMLRRVAHVFARATRRNIPEDNILQEDALSPLIFNFSLEYAIRKVQENQVGLTRNGTHQLLAYADDVNLLGDKRYYKHGTWKIKSL
jgi:hypothetical protein